jgi:hypothetical protein
MSDRTKRNSYSIMLRRRMQQRSIFWRLLRVLKENRSTNITRFNVRSPWISYNPLSHRHRWWPVEMWWHRRRNQISSFGQNGRVHLNRQGRQFSRLLAAEVCASAVVMLDTPCSEVVWRYWLPTPFASFPLHFPSRASPCAITFQLESSSTYFTIDGGGGVIAKSSHRTAPARTLNGTRL